MAVSKFTDWSWYHKFGNYIIVRQNYAVYADMSNGNAQPYLRLSNCEIQSLDGSYRSYLNARVPCTVKIQINGTGTTYTFNSGSTLKYQEGSLYDEDVGRIVDDYYYVSYSSSTNINIPKNGTEFSIVVTITTKTGETHTFTEHAAGPIAQVISGPASIYTGAISTYKLSRPFQNNAYFSSSAEFHYYFSTWGSTSTGVDGYSDPYTSVADSTEQYGSFSIVPLRTLWNEQYAVPVGSKGSTESRYGLDYHAYYKKDTEEFRARGWWGFSGGTLLLTSVHKAVSITARAEVDSALKSEYIDTTHGRYGYYNSQISDFGALVQHHIDYYYELNYRTKQNHSGNYNMKYGNDFYKTDVYDYTDGSLVHNTYDGKTSYHRGILNTVVTNASVRMKLRDQYGFNYERTEYVTVLPYHDPTLTFTRARRCSPLTGESDGEIFYDDAGNPYTVDDYGAYAVIEWAADFAPINNRNVIGMRIKVPTASTSGSGQTYKTVSIDLPSYQCSGYLITQANTEYSYDIEFELSDSFHGINSSRYEANGSGPVKSTLALNTALTIFDMLRGGAGVALGKVAEEKNTLDIHRNWILNMPYNTMVQNYKSDGSAINLGQWMAQVNQRMNAITEAKDDPIFSRPSWYQNNSGVCIPSAYGTVYSFVSTGDMRLLPSTGRTAGFKLAKSFKVTKNYLNITLMSSESFAGTAWNTATYRPKIYLLSSEPTTINQSTGAPNGTVISSTTISGRMTNVGAYDDGYCFWHIYGGENLNYYFNVAGYMGKNLWLVITCTQGGASPSGYYKYGNAHMDIASIVLSNNHV